MSRFGFVTPNDPPRAPGAPKPRKNQPALPPGPRKMPRKIAKAARLIFQNWKDRSHIKRILNKLGYKRETSERCSNPLNPESTPYGFTRISPSAFINFSISMDDAKIAAGDVPKFLGKRTYPEKCPFAVTSTNKFSLLSGLAFRNSRNRFRIIKIRRQYIRREIP